MATINLGSIKFNWRGAYNNSTAYAVDDVVSSGGSSYICILASTGNAVTNTTYWNVMSQGGTDVGTTLTTQGDILYRDGSGLQRLAAGTSGQFLKTQGSGANVTWSDAGGGLQSIQTFTSSGTYTKPSGINKIKVYVTGGGGGGGGTASSGYGYQAGTGGGAGGTAIKLLDASSITTVTVTIGAGGTGSGASAGTNGSTSSFGSHATATGGTGGVRPGAFNYPVPGGLGASGDINLRGGAGGDAIEDNAGAVWGGIGGVSFWGGNGAPQWSGTAGTTQAGIHGGGGAGSSASSGQGKAGGNGGSGFVVVEEYK